MKQYESHRAEVAVTAPAGSAVLIKHRVFHGNDPNQGTYPREMLAIAYRPAWAGPASPVDEWPEDRLDQLPANVRVLMGSRNQRVWHFDGSNKPDEMTTDAPGLDPGRWKHK